MSVNVCGMSVAVNWSFNVIKNETEVTKERIVISGLNKMRWEENKKSPSNKKEYGWYVFACITL